VREPRARGVSLWLMPEGEVRDRLSARIASLSAGLGTAPFPPHVTLLSGVEGLPDGEVRAVVRALAAGLRPLSVRLVDVEGRDEPFRCLFARASADPPLVSAHAAAARAFGRAPDPAFFPHLSLVYGALGAEAKERLAAELRSETAGVFEAARVHVWGTEGPVRAWREIGSIAFPRSPL
jgi:hypothetical protein